MNFGIDSDNPAETAPAKPILPPDPLRNSRNFRLDDDVASHIAEGGPKARIQHNLDILELFKTIQGEQRTAAPDEQNRIAQYIDFGGLRELWDQGYRYYEERNRLAEILTEEEIDAVKETSLNTHYTAIEIVDQMWEAAGRLGFAGGRILEPGMGVGNFFARIPDQFLHESELFGVEKNPLSGALASLLYPDAKILVQPFEDTRLPNNSFDLVIGNPPFADIKIADPEYSDPKLSLHNYFLVKSLDKLKPGGIAVCISSHYTLDSLDVRPRRALAARADLIAAIRLPEDAFQKNANTSVTTDILFFRKRLPNEPQPEHPVWIDSLSHVIPGYSDSSAVNYNAYFDEHPEMVLGVHSAETQSFVALKLLLTKMQDVFETVEPAQANLQTHGHKIRELLLLAAMEVEASWAAVLKANSYTGDRLTTKDYVKLLTPMLLDSFSLNLRSYPEFPTVAPFRNWTVQSPTQSLDWYDAYNQTKHNREECLEVATLDRAVNAVGAAVVMFYAQFGYTFQHDDEKRGLIRSIFTLKVDHEMHPTACYIPNAEGGTKAWDWELLDYPFPAG